jgi:hypothetical protein
MDIKLTNKEIGRLLDRSAGQLDRSTLNRLETVRHLALQKQRISGRARDGELSLGRLHLPGYAFNWIVAAVVAGLLVINLSYWNHTFERDHSDIDIAILTDDLPVDVYVN